MKNLEAQDGVLNLFPIMANIRVLIKMELGSCRWEKSLKACVWSVTTDAFHEALCIGELCARRSGCFDRKFNLLKQDVEITSSKGVESLDIKLKHSKIFLGQAEIINLAGSGSAICPVRAYKRVAQLTKHLQEDSTAFATTDGKPNTKQKFTELIRKLLKPVLANYRKISGHSFRMHAQQPWL